MSMKMSDQKFATSNAFGYAADKQMQILGAAQKSATPIDRLTFEVNAIDSVISQVSSLADKLVGAMPEAGGVASREEHPDMPHFERIEALANRLAWLRSGLSQNIDRIGAQL